MENPNPKKIYINHSGESLLITYQWRNRMTILGAIFAVIWLFVIAIVGQMMSEKPATDQTDWFFWWIMAVVGVYLSYTILGSLFNKTVIKGDREMISVSFGPIPWRLSRKVEKSTVSQFFIKERIAHYRKTSTTHRKRYSATFQIMAEYHSGKSQNLIPDLKTEKEAKYIKLILEEFWDVTPIEIKGENLSSE